MLRKLIFHFFIMTLVFSCNEQNEKIINSDPQVNSISFENLEPEQTGINFSNNISESDSFNLFNYEYIYNGGGVAAGDINNDGLTDLYFTGNQVSDKLYLNKGNFQFEDITQKAIGNSSGWRTGVVMVDINNDGWLDIYVSRSGLPSDKNDLANLLYVNNGDLTFSEKAAEYGIDIKRNTTQSAFFDFDNDGDLDLYVMNHLYNKINLTDGNSSGASMSEINQAFNQFSDMLLRNDNGKFVDVSKEAGIFNYAFGLGLAISDFNNDGYQDIYVSNDYSMPDFLYMNQGNGTFKNEIWQRTGHISNFSMGNDAADFNNDGYTDIMCLDMVSEDHARSKRNMGGMNSEKFWSAVKNGLHYQYMFNTLQLNNGDGTFSEIAQLAGVAKTDWSWAPLFADFDNDGYQDLFITNGYKRDARDIDATTEIKQKQLQKTDFKSALELLPSTKIQNYMYRNKGELKFEKVNESWNLTKAINSNGAVYVDLDNDGDLDIVTNNMDEPASIFKNNLSSKNHFIRLKIIGNNLNKMSVGAKIKVQCGDHIQYREVYVERGFQSSVDPIIHMGLGQKKSIDEIHVIWPDKKEIKLQNIEADQLLEIDYKNATQKQLEEVKNEDKIFTESNESILNFTHKENYFDDFKREVLLPHKMSEFGPLMASGDCNGDGLEDLYISGSVGSSGKLFLQQKDGKFQEKNGPWNKEAAREELGSLLFDADKDGDLDLYVVSGSNEYAFDHPLMQDQIYINDGKANFTNETSLRLPLMQSSGMRVTSGDFDKDGDLDLFVGGRQVPGKYPFAPRSFLLENNDGIFKDITSKSPDLLNPGMIAESLFDDYDLDGDLDLICVGEWMPISFFENNNGIFVNATAKMKMDKTNGWWMSLNTADFNGDGKKDYVVGNIGENNKFHPTFEKPLEIYCHDFDNNGTFDIVLGKYQDGACYPVRGKQCSSEQMPFINQKFPTYGSFSSADLTEIYGKENLKNALHYSAYEFRSGIVMSQKNGYSFIPFPIYAQFGPINSTIIHDFNKDGLLDILAAGNMYGAEVETIRYDANPGVLLLGDGNDGFTHLKNQNCGFSSNGNIRELHSLKQSIIISKNNGDFSFVLIR